MDDKTMIEKVREWVDKELKLQGYEHRVILDFIDSLNSPEKQSEPKFMYKQKWRPEPGQMIEVSIDGKNWERWEFSEMENDYFKAAPGDWQLKGFILSWKYARPLPDKRLPEFSEVDFKKYYKIQKETTYKEPEKVRDDYIWNQIQRITDLINNQ